MIGSGSGMRPPLSVAIHAIFILLPRACVVIRIDKPANRRVIVPALQIIEPGFLVAVIAAIAQGVDGGQVALGESEKSPSNQASLYIAKTARYAPATPGRCYKDILFVL